MLFINKGMLFINKGMLSINTELIIINADLLFVTAGIKKFPPWDYKIPTLGLKRSQGGKFCVGAWKELKKSFISFDSCSGASLTR